MIQMSPSISHLGRGRHTVDDTMSPSPTFTQGSGRHTTDMQMSPSPWGELICIILPCVEGLICIGRHTVDDTNEPLPHLQGGDTLWMIQMSPSPTFTQGRGRHTTDMQMSPSPWGELICIILLCVEGLICIGRHTVDDTNEPLPHLQGGDTLWMIQMSPPPPPPPPSPKVEGDTLWMIQMSPSPTFTQSRGRHTVDDTNEPLPHLHTR